MSDPAILDRVRKLLALAGSPNLHEAAAAAGRAQELIARHRLEAYLAAEQAIALDPISDGSDAPLEVARKIRKWKRVLAAALAEANGAMAWTQDRGKDQAICVVGTDADRAAVATLWADLVKRIEWLSATEGEGRPRDWHEAFRIGASEAIAERLAAGTQDARADLPEGALALVDPAEAAQRDALERFLADRFGPAKGGGIRVDPRAYEAGRKAAAKLT